MDTPRRYRLEREVAPMLEGTLGFVMLNPSTADDSVDDPTIRRCRGFAESYGLGYLAVANLFSERATDPRHLLDGRATAAPDPDDLAAWDWIMGLPGRTVVAWGSLVNPALQRMAQPRVACVIAAAARHRRQLFLLGLTQNGNPRHPLYVRKTAELQLARTR